MNYPPTHVQPALRKRPPRRTWQWRLADAYHKRRGVRLRPHEVTAVIKALLHHEDEMELAVAEPLSDYIC